MAQPERERPRHPVKVTTLEQARALPEVQHAFCDYTKRILQHDDPEHGPAGTTVIERVVRPYFPMPTHGDQLLFFTDADGRLMQVCYTADGPAKAEWHGL